jgi:hypothetical protein
MVGYSIEKSKILRFLVILVLGLSAIFIGDSANASGTGASSFFPAIFGATHNTGVRESIELKCSNGVSSGRPKNKTIKLIIIILKNCRAGELILRELKFSAGRKSILFTTHVSLMEEILRVTLYVNHDTKNISLLEYRNGSWYRRKAQALPATFINYQRASKHELLAFSAEGLGPFWLIEGTSPFYFASTDVFHKPTARALLGEGLSRGLLPWGYAILLLGVGWYVSHSLHRKECDSGK